MRLVLYLGPSVYEGAKVEESYECWGPDAEDFTDLLREKYDAGEIPWFYFEDGEERWKFEVTCKQGHRNVFSGAGRP
jgi:hypothetical protein